MTSGISACKLGTKGATYVRGSNGRSESVTLYITISLNVNEYISHTNTNTLTYITSSRLGTKGAKYARDCDKCHKMVTLYIHK